MILTRIIQSADGRKEEQTIIVNMASHWMTKTKVSIVAFDLNFSKGITIDDFFNWMILTEKKEIRVAGYTTNVISQLHNNYIIGLVVAYKGDKKILATRKEGEDLAIDKVSLREDQNSTQASIFCIEPTSKSGMFYSYHSGVSATSFGSTLKRIHDKAKLSKARYLREEKNKGKGRLSKVEKEHFSGQFSLKVKYKELDIKNLVEQFSDASSLDITMGPAIELAPLFRPINPFANTYKTTIYLNGKQSKTGKMAAVKNLWDSIVHKDAIKGFKIAGKTLLGEELSAKIGDNIQHFGQMYLDDYIDKLPDDRWENFVSCEATNLLLKKIKENVAVIPKPKAVESWKTTLNKKDDLSELGK